MNYVIVIAIIVNIVIGINIKKGEKYVYYYNRRKRNPFKNYY